MDVGVKGNGGAKGTGGKVKEWKVVAKDGRDVHELLAEEFRALGEMYAEGERGPELVVYVSDIDEEKREVYIATAWEFPGTVYVWDGYGSPCVEIARYRADMWDIEQTYVDREKGVWYAEDGEPYPIEEFIRDLADEFAVEERDRVEKGALEIAEEILWYENR